jgi:NAD(P)-dependent dehydrogenase (short-subunit alcohol dehydrogenase family)
MTTRLRFDGEVAVVTGGGRGVGRAHAHALAERGARVVVNDLGGSVAGTGSGDPRPAAQVAREIADLGGEAIASTADVATEDGAASIIATALAAWGQVDIVVNNAGNLDPGALPELTVDAVERHLDIHVLGSFNVTRAAWPHMASRRYGRVIVTTSIGMFGGPHLLAYATAKGAAVSLGRSLALTGAEHGILVNMLAPAAETRMVTDPVFRARAGLPPLPEDREPDPSRGPEHVTPMLLVLAHRSCPANGETFGAGLGRFARIFWAETPGIVAPGLEPEELLARWDEVVGADSYGVPASSADSVSFREGLIDAHRREGGAG